MHAQSLLVLTRKIAVSGARMTYADMRGCNPAISIPVMVVMLVSCKVYLFHVVSALLHCLLLYFEKY